jgi:hypothetical protein
MFGEALFQVSTKLRDGPAQAFSEGVATFGLIAAILGSIRFRPDATPTIVGLYITSAYWFTASTSFANPAVTIARALSNTLAGIAPSSVPAFIAAQLVGAVVATFVFDWLLQEFAIRLAQFLRSILTTSPSSRGGRVRLPACPSRAGWRGPAGPCAGADVRAGRASTQPAGTPRSSARSRRLRSWPGCRARFFPRSATIRSSTPWSHTRSW